MENTLLNKVQSVQANTIELPVLRDLVKRVQEMPHEQRMSEDRMWTDSNWKQWKQHSSHNPW